MAAIKVSEGATVVVKGLGRTGSVRSLTSQRIPGKRGRPTTLATVIYEDGTEGVHGVRELTLV